MNRADTQTVLRLLPHFEAVARTGQITAAAAELGLPQPTVSRAIARLNELIGSPLVERVGRAVALTPAGEAFRPFAEAALQQLESGLDLVARDVEISSGTLRVTFQEIAGENVLPDFIRRFRNRYPSIRYELNQTSRQHCLRALTEGKVDVVLMSNPPQSDDFDAITLRKDPLVVMTPTNDPLVAAGRVGIEALIERELIVMKRGFGLRDEVDALFADIGRTPRIALEVEDVHTALALTAAGIAIAILPRTRATLTAEGVREVPIDHPDAVRTIAALTRGDADSPMVDAVRRVLAAR